MVARTTGCGWVAKISVGRGWVEVRVLKFEGIGILVKFFLDI